MICALISALVAMFVMASRSSCQRRKMLRAEKIANGGFLLALSGLLAKVAMADGEVTADEADEADKVFSNMGLSRAERAMCVGNFLLAQRETGEAHEDAKALAAALNHVACLFLYGLLWRVANADWRIAEGEERILGELGEALGVKQDERELFRAGKVPPLDRKALEDAGVPPSLIHLSQSPDGTKDADRGVRNR